SEFKESPVRLAATRIDGGGDKVEMAFDAGPLEPVPDASLPSPLSVGPYSFSYWYSRQRFPDSRHQPNRARAQRDIPSMQLVHDRMTEIKDDGCNHGFTRESAGNPRFFRNRKIGSLN